MSLKRKIRRKAHSVTLRYTDVKTHHFFALPEGDFGNPLRDEEGRIRVWANRDQGLSVVDALPGDWTLIGMGDDKWELFQESEDYAIEPSNLN